MRISDWSSDVCSSDLADGELGVHPLVVLVDIGAGHPQHLGGDQREDVDRLTEAGNLVAVSSAAGIEGEGVLRLGQRLIGLLAHTMEPASVDHQGFELQIGRASCRESVCQYV